MMKHNQQKDYISIPLFTLKPASHIRQTHTQSSTEYSIGSEIQSVEIEVWIPIMVDIITVSWHFINQNHCNDNAVNGIGFTENDTTFHNRVYNTNLIRFFDRILGAFTHPPIKVEAAVQIPLEWTLLVKTYQAAPTTDKARPQAIPINPRAYGEMWLKTWVQSTNKRWNTDRNLHCKVQQYYSLLVKFNLLDSH